MPDFGKIDYAFIDKTGTLIQNQTEIKAIDINKKIYYFTSSMDESHISIKFYLKDI